MQKESISILGCGWLGLPLGGALSKEGYCVRGSTTKEEKLDLLRDAGIEPFLVTLDPEIEGEDLCDFLQSDILILNIPPSRREDVVEYHIQQISSLIDALGQSPVRSVLFVSSTSVYPMLNREVSEEDAVDPESPSGQALLHAEEMLMQETGFQTTVLRFGGLVGYDRGAESYLARMKEIADPQLPMNLIHRDDCVRIIMEIIRLRQWGEVFNACSPEHPVRRDYYRRAAEAAGIALPPEAADGGTRSFKLVNSRKLENALGYTFMHPVL
ncbi:MAG: SDR family oxidoreductase [Chlorobium sp.]|jgi:nucleoside-diphosphate-sugar epimerase|uniref:SDR family oxidoreductase n=1 Tax=Chlorobium sp. TaxID=1095 RepID=UPI001D608922|nr:SDR family oxidoreductase [Chlorobium sp.]MBN1278603.1 SDR family oxidoreductase [Chlorobiaceae bacterium]MCF8216698.1 SDR family oxidoreductase [Chlorobium sp.]MCF8271581.1 SDR family oxidoreductase [Chlorobium sp.]MCF8287938.1 SDR family oxidoreductase [Chlorobium sp.]MCF8291483.1 SDR family oxidoreductase [Chlorobium sp.]